MGGGHNNDLAPSGPGPKRRAGGRARASGPVCSTELPGPTPPTPPPRTARAPGHTKGWTPRTRLAVTGRQRRAMRGRVRQQGLTRLLLTHGAAPGAQGHQTAPNRMPPGAGSRAHRGDRHTGPPCRTPTARTLARHRARGRAPRLSCGPRRGPAGCCRGARATSNRLRIPVVDRGPWQPSRGAMATTGDRRAGTQPRRGPPAKQHGSATRATGVRRTQRRLAGAIPPLARDTPHG